MDLLKFATAFYVGVLGEESLKSFAQKAEEVPEVRKMQEAIDGLMEAAFSSPGLNQRLAILPTNNPVHLNPFTRKLHRIRSGYQRGKAGRGATAKFDGLWGKGVESALEGVEEISKDLGSLGILDEVTLSSGLDYNTDSADSIRSAAKTNIPFIKDLTREIKGLSLPSEGEIAAFKVWGPPGVKKKTAPFELPDFPDIPGPSMEGYDEMPRARISKKPKPFKWEIKQPPGSDERVEIFRPLSREENIAKKNRATLMAGLKGSAERQAAAKMSDEKISEILSHSTPEKRRQHFNVEMLIQGFNFPTSTSSPSFGEGVREMDLEEAREMFGNQPGERVLPLSNPKDR